MKTNKIILFAALLLLAIGLTGCAYFNVFYNAKSYYSKAIKSVEKSKSDKVPADAVRNFNSAIEKASKVLDVYPNSKWCDDALLLISRSYYHMGNYDYTVRSLRDLIENFPESKLIPEARHLYAKTLLLQNQFDLASTEFQKITESDANDEIKSEAFFGLADRYFYEEKYEEAVTQYLRILDTIKNKDVRMQAQLKLAESYRLLEEYDKAAVEFKKVREFKPPANIVFQAEFGYGLTLQDIGRYDEAVEVFTSLLDDRRFVEYYEDVFIEVARTHELKGDVDEAIKILERLNSLDLNVLTSTRNVASMLTNQPQTQTGDQRRTDDFDQPQKPKQTNPNTQSNTGTQQGPAGADLRNTGAQNRPDQQAQGNRNQNTTGTGPANKTGNPRALFYIGELHLHKNFDLAEATKYYNNALQLKPEPELSSEINIRLNLIKELTGLRTSLELVPPQKPVFQSAHDQQKEQQGEPLMEEKQAAVDSTGQVSKPPETEQSIPDRMKDKIKKLEETEEKPKKVREEEIKPQSNIVVVNDAESYKQASDKYKEDFKVYLKARSESLYRMAELMIIQFELPDSSLYYLDLLINETEENEFKPKGLFLQYSILSGLGDPSKEDVLSKLVSEYSTTEYALTFLIESDSLRSAFIQSQEEKNAPVDSAKVLYDEAMKYVFEENEQVAAIESLLDIVENHHESEYSKKALYSVGWILENRIRDNALALITYERLLSDYPEFNLDPLVVSRVERAKTFKAERDRLIELDRKRKVALAGGDSTLAAQPDSLLEIPAAVHSVSQEPQRTPAIQDSTNADSTQVIEEWIDFSRIDSLIMMNPVADTLESEFLSLQQGLLSEELIKRITADTIPPSVIDVELIPLFDLSFDTFMQDYSIDPDTPDTLANMKDHIKSHIDTSVISSFDSLEVVRFDSLVSSKLENWIIKSAREDSLDTVTPDSTAVQDTTGSAPAAIPVPAVADSQTVKTDSIKTVKPDTIKIKN